MDADPTDPCTMHATRRTSRTLALLVLLGLGTHAQRGSDMPDEHRLPRDWANAIPWRSIGPSNMGGRITDVAVAYDDPTEWWCATASGGVLYTDNAGRDYAHLFDDQETVSLGAIAVAPSDSNILWVGTGESNPRNSVSWGNGVYRSTDKGETWRHMGLDETYQIGAVVIHPEDPNTVYVAALGRLWGPNEERGLYKTTDGGENWEKVLYVDVNTGCMDVILQPGSPDTLIAATYERRRDGFDTNDPAVKFGEGAALWKSTNGGDSWLRLEDGLPTVKLGRMGLCWYEGDPNIVYAVIETERIAQLPADAAYMGMSGEDAEVGARLTRIVDDGPSEAAGLQENDIVISLAGEHVSGYDDMVKVLRLKKAGEVAEVTFIRDRERMSTEITFGEREGISSPWSSGLGGQRENIQDEQGDEGFEQGGVYRSDDAGDSWTRINSVNPRPMYYSQIRVDPSDNNYIYVLGTSLYRSSDGGMSFRSDGARGGVHVDHHALWIDPRDGRNILLGNDGGIYVSRDRMDSWDHHNHVAIGQFYHVTAGPRADYYVYGGLQDNGSWGGPARSATGGAINSDWISIGGGDGFVCAVDPNDPDLIYYESQNGGLGARNLRTGQRYSPRPRGERGLSQEWNWKSPFVLSSHNGSIYYTASNYVFRSVDQGRDHLRISERVTRGERGSSTALAESPIDRRVLYVGTDDGGLWGTIDGGVSWTDLMDVGGFPMPEPEPEEDEDAEEGGEDEEEDEPEPLASLGPALLEQHDADGDGSLTRDELPASLAGLFALADVDGDEELSSAELGLGGGREVSEGKGKRLSELIPEPMWVSTIEASRFAAGRVYVALDGHRSNFDDPFALASEDYGRTWRLLSGDLPEGSSRCLREDRVNEDLLYLGTEFGLWVSVDRGQRWTKCTNLPTVAVHELAQHAGSGEVVAGTHGRSLWIADMTPLRGMTPDALEQSAYLYPPAPATRWRFQPSRGRTLRRFVGQNPPSGTSIDYHLNDRARELRLYIEGLGGEILREWEEPERGKGFHRVRWDLRAGRSSDPRQRGSRPLGSGTYLAVLEVDGERLTRQIEVRSDPNEPGALTREEYEWLYAEELAAEGEEDGEEEERGDL